MWHIPHHSYFTLTTAALLSREYLAINVSALLDQGFWGSNNPSQTILFEWINNQKVYRNVPLVVSNKLLQHRLISSGQGGAAQSTTTLPSHFWAHTQPRSSLLCLSFCSSIPDIYPIQPNPISERRRYPWGFSWELRQDLCETCKTESAGFGNSQTIVGTVEEENERRQRWIDMRGPWVVEKSSQEFLRIFTQFITIFGGQILCQPKSCKISRSDTVATQDLCKKGKFLSTHKPPMSWDSVSDLSRDNQGSSSSLIFGMVCTDILHLLACRLLAGLPSSAHLRRPHFISILSIYFLGLPQPQKGAKSSENSMNLNIWKVMSFLLESRNSNFTIFTLRSELIAELLPNM